MICHYFSDQESFELFYKYLAIRFQFMWEIEFEIQNKTGNIIIFAFVLDIFVRVI